MREKSLMVAVIACLAWTSSAFAQIRNLDEGYPVMMEDAEPMTFGILQGCGNLRFSSLNDGTHEFRIDPGARIGFAEGWQGSLSVPVVWGTTLQTRGGDILASALYNFLPESERRPGLALEGFVDVPMARSVQNADIRLKFIATRTVDEESGTRLHLNATWGILAVPGANERRYRFLGSAGISRAIGEDVTLAADFSHEEERVAAITSDLIEAGVRKAIGKVSAVSVSAGVGLFNQSLAYRVLAGMQFWICDVTCPPGALK